jgi:hypothetical protein
MKHALLLISVMMLTGCAATKTGGPVKIGEDTYMMGGLGGAFDHSGSVVKAKYIKQAADHCAGMGRDIRLLNSTGLDATMTAYASAEVQYRCVPR